VVEKVTETTDSDGVPVRKLYLDKSGNKITTLIDENAFHDNGNSTSLSYDYTDISSGDIIYFTESNGKVDIFQIRYDADLHSVAVSKGSSNGFYNGYIYSVKNDGIKFVLTDDITRVEGMEENGEYRVFNPDKTKINIIKKYNDGVNLAKTASASDLAGYDIAKEECSKVLIHIYEKSDYNQQTRTVYIYE